MTSRQLSPGDLHAELETRLWMARQPRPTQAGAQRQRLHIRGRIPAAVVSAIAVMLLGVLSVFADGGTLDVLVNNSTEYAVDTTTDGAIVEYIGKDSIDFGSTGTGVINSFLQTQHNPSEAGYNTNGTKEFDTGSSPTFNRAILVSQIPVVPCISLDESETTAGVCWELFSDINDSNANNPAAAQIQLTELEIWFTTNANITGYVQAGDAGFPTGATKVYDFEGAVHIRDVNSGSGRGDLRYLIPLNGISLPSGCAYGSSTCATYFVVYTEWGDPADGPFKSDSGFEEWTVKRYPFLDVQKTATATYTRTFEWDIEKSVTPENWALFDGDSGTSDYTVDVTKTGFTDSNWAVSGTITIDNPSDQDAPIQSVTDQISGFGSVSVNCGVSFPYTLPDGDTLVCTYSTSLPDGASRTNSATATLTTGPTFSDEADVAFGAPTNVVNGTVHVDDTYSGGPQDQAFSDTGQVTYSRTFECGDDDGTHDNTATITETSQSDDASVTVSCYDLSVLKTADESRTRTWNWTINKNVDPDSWSLFDGDTGTSDYVINLDKVDFTDTDWHVEGTITISNNHPTMSATLTQVADSISGFGAVTVSCPSLTVPAGGDLECSYEADLPNGTSRTNTATATQQNYDYDSAGSPTTDGTTDYSDTETIDFSAAETIEVNAEVNVTDTYSGSYGPFSDDDTIEYSRTFGCDEVEYTDGLGSYTADNTATIDETGQNDSASVDVDCYILDVTKGADESFDRTYEWTIEKSADQTAVEIMPGQQFLVNYSVTVDVIGTTDDNFHVDGGITISNPNPDRDADLTHVVDSISGFGAATVNCPSLTVPAGGDLECSYEADLPDGTSRTNTATATQQNYDYDSSGSPTADGTTDYSGTADVVFGDPTSLVDECVDVTDTIAGALDTVCVGDAPMTFDYPEYVGPYTDLECGEHDVPNTASFLTNDTGATGSSSWNVHITVPCPEGCTLTQGYWKTHSEYGPAPEDPNWYLIPQWYLDDYDNDGIWEGPNEYLFTTGDTWYQSFWTAVKGRPYYQLAHQWMAAMLNAASIQDLGGSVPANVQTALIHGADLLRDHSLDKDLKGKNAKAIRADFVATAGILGSFNEGSIGPGHCDEDGTSEPTVASNAIFVPPLALLALIAGAIVTRRRMR